MSSPRKNAENAANGVFRKRQPKGWARQKKRDLGACWYDAAGAAAKLDLEPQALRARLRRAQKMENGEIVSRLGMGVMGRKLGFSWRVFVPDPADQAIAGQTRAEPPFRPPHSPIGSARTFAKLPTALPVVVPVRKPAARRPKAKKP
jgi:hypothetical protein